MKLADKLMAAGEIMEKLEQAGRISVINWLYIVDGELPDDDVRVYVAIEDRDGPVDAYHSCDRWIEDETGEHLLDVYAWGHIPALPPLPKPVVEEGEG